MITFSTAQHTYNFPAIPPCRGVNELDAIKIPQSNFSETIARLLTKDLGTESISLDIAKNLIIESDKEKQIKKNQEIICLLNSWLTEDEGEQKETWEYLKEFLDKDRLSDRKFF